MPPTAAATFCATLVDEWARAGSDHAVVAPGSRSTPLALALAADERLRLHVFHDERAAAFAALGLGLATGRPAVLLCTSGTAATHFHAAVAEADLSNVPLLVCTADRPPEMWQVGAPQTIDQTRLYGGAVRFFAEPGVADDAARGSWRSLAARAVAEALGASGRPGPVHLNLPFREPLVGEPGELPPGRAGDRAWHGIGPRPGSAPPPAPEVVDRVVELVDGRRGVVVAGAGIADPHGVSVLAARLGWPVLADHRSGCRALPEAVGHADPLLRQAAFARRHRPEAVLRLGEPLSSKVVAQWLAGSGAVQVGVERHGAWRDPERALDVLIRAEPGELARCVAGRLSAPAVGELAAWRSADDAAAAALAAVVDGHGGQGRRGASDEARGVTRAPISEPGVVRAALDATPAGGALVVASSMPVRDLEWFGGRRGDVAVFANRGANGIDGVVSTAIGVALSGVPTVCVVGDVAFLHDSTALIGLAGRAVDVTVVIVDNDGGGIFSFLPQAGQLPADRFELLFGTPHGADLAALSAAHGLTVETPQGGAGEVADAISRAVAAGGRRVVRVGTDRRANVALHQQLERAVAEACR